MKTNHLNRFAGIHTAIATILALSSASQGADRYWDNNGNTLGFGNPTGGAWNGTNTFWNTSSTGEGIIGDLTATTAAADNLFFPGNGATGTVINLSISQSAASLSFNNPSPGYMPLQISNGASLTVSGAITDTGSGPADIRIHNTTEANAATKLTASSITMNVVTVDAASGGTGQFFTSGYDITMATQYSIGSFSGTGGNTTIRQTAGTVTVTNPADRGFVFLATNDFASSSLYTNRYILDGGTMKANRIGIANNDGNNNANNRWARDTRLEFNSGTLQSFTNGTLFLQNQLTFGTYDGTGTKDMGYNTSKPITVELAQTGAHTFNADGASGNIIVTPSAKLVDKTGEAGTVTKVGLGTLVFAGGNSLAANTYTGSTTVNAGLVSTDYNRIAGSAATGGTDNLSNGYSSVSDLVLDGGNYSLVGRGSADAGSATGVALNAGSGGLTVTLASTAGLVIGQSVTNANLPGGTYIRRILNGTQIELNAMSTSITNLTGETLTFGAASFNNTQTIDNVSLLQNATFTVTPGAGTSTTLLSFGDVTDSGKLTKAGTGKLQLTGSVSHTGPTAINAGTLEFASSSDQTIIAPVTGSGTFVKSGSGILTMDAIPASRHLFSGAVIVNGGTLTNVGNAEGLFQATSFTVNNGGILLSLGDGVGFGGMGALTVNAGGTFGGGVQQISSLTLNGGLIDGTGSYLSVNFALNQDVTVGGSSASTIQGNAGIALSGSSAAAGVTRTFDVADATGNASADLTISTVVRNSYVNNRLANLQKSGAGTMLLSGVNIYTGDTTVLDGTLAVNGTSLHNSTKLVIDGGKVDLTGAETVDTYFIGAVQQAAGTYSANGTTLTGLGTLIVTTGPSTSNYAAWQSANSTAQTADLDHDNDGVSNGVEHFLGGIANTTGNSNPLPGVINTAGTLSVTWVRNPGFSGFPANYGSAFLVETSATLANPWTAASEGGGAGFVEITGDSVKYTFPAGTKNFARLKVVP